MPSMHEARPTNSRLDAFDVRKNWLTSMIPGDLSIVLADQKGLLRSLSGTRPYESHGDG